MRGWTQERLAEAMGTKASAVARFENGRVLPRLDTLERTCRALGARLVVRLEPEVGERGEPGAEGTSDLEV
jgi:transcriptional regulator with XRE-family HTH domain